ncbi:hypothetical protein GCM10007973_13330 [Polymorphobacter multimanifer]|uniref:Uncharacterized protein n=1 Tax=Polymorphobacter multimanifer TaxID=1070431 RepID=A0A841L7Y9_9SPHN|nr:hypothetical protein [Polymorphobacter multimanifer]MBB6227073.1 hypothetical protein [Polymorphobacter multimanifer]GGI77825.1 hypothetical protein GCM10007973_13330 [Polymorphobacter multimanifer]
MTDKQDDSADDKTNILGVRKGKGPDQYGGSFAGGQSGGGAYANARQTTDPVADKDQGGQTEPGYYGGGQAADENSSNSDHHAARRTETNSDSSYKDHPSQKTGQDNADFKQAMTREDHRGKGE